MNAPDPTKFKDPTPYVKPTLVFAVITFLAMLINPYAGFLSALVFVTMLGTLLWRYFKIQRWLKSRGIDTSKEH